MGPGEGHKARRVGIYSDRSILTDYIVQNAVKERSEVIPVTAHEGL
jgi:hypothetical protein